MSYFIIFGTIFSTVRATNENWSETRICPLVRFVRRPIRVTTGRPQRLNADSVNVHTLRVVTVIFVFLNSLGRFSTGDRVIG